jgi:hypothetical protein
LDFWRSPASCGVVGAAQVRSFLALRHAQDLSCGIDSSKARSQVSLLFGHREKRTHWVITEMIYFDLVRANSSRLSQRGSPSSLHGLGFVADSQHDQEFAKPEYRHASLCSLNAGSLIRHHVSHCFHGKRLYRAFTVNEHPRIE